jgi:Ca2+-binding EF-hand superfamily protein
MMNDIAQTVYNTYEPLPESQVDELMNRLDLNRDNELQYDEFLLLLESLPIQVRSGESLNHIKLKKSDFRQAMEAILKFFGRQPSGNFIFDLQQLSGFEDDEFSDNLAKYFFAFYDKNGNNLIDRNEYKKLGKDIEQVLGRDQFRPGKFMKLFGKEKDAELSLDKFQQIFKQLNEMVE